MSKISGIFLVVNLFFLPSAFLFSQPVSKNEVLGKFGGTYVSEFLSTAGAVYYGESITFKFETDSFFYWHVKNGSGQGRYKFVNDTLVLNFSGSRILPSNFKVIPFEAKRKDSCSLEVHTNYDSSGHSTRLLGVTIEVSNKDNKVIYSKSLNNSRFKIGFSEFPITLNAYCLGFQPVSLVLANQNDYNIVMNMLDSRNFTLNHGETIKYFIHSFEKYSIVMSEIDYFNGSSSKSKSIKKFMFSSYKRM